jgi:hypothetical protein
MGLWTMQQKLAISWTPFLFSKNSCCLQVPESKRVGNGEREERVRFWKKARRERWRRWRRRRRRGRSAWPPPFATARASPRRRRRLRRRIPPPLLPPSLAPSPSHPAAYTTIISLTPLCLSLWSLLAVVPDSARWRCKRYPAALYKQQGVHERWRLCLVRGAELAIAM